MQDVREQRYVVTCEQDGCGRKARGTVPEFAEHGWQMADGRAHGKEQGVVFFCPKCSLRLTPA